MCGKAMQNSKLIRPGVYMNFNVFDKIIAGRWGMFQDKDVQQPIIKIESLRSTWRGQMDNRGVLELDGFFEQGFYFHAKEGFLLRLPIIFDKNYDFALITKDARGLVKEVCKRQPIIIDEGREDAWIDDGKILQAPDDHLFRVNENKLP